MVKGGCTPLADIGVALRLAELLCAGIWGAAFAMGFLASGGGDPRHLALGLALVFLWTVIVNVFNRMADTTEDRVDYPWRVLLTEKLGITRLSRFLATAAVIYIGALIAGLAGGVVSLRATLSWLGMLFGAVLYSHGPRVKRKRLLSPITNGLMPAIFVGLGALGAGGLAQLMPAAIVVCVFGVTLSLCGLKDVPNIEGDSTIGLRSTYWDLAAGRRWPAALTLLATPYVAITLGVGRAMLPQRELFVLGLAPAIAVLLLLLRQAQTLSARVAVRELAHLYWHLVDAVALIAFRPLVSVTVAAMVGLLWHLMMARLFNCDPPRLTSANLRAAMPWFGPAATGSRSWEAASSALGNKLHQNDPCSRSHRGSLSFGEFIHGS